ncbi:MAG TPA: sigma-70 family RNA polymerase sigma factor [Terriglobales bacterium]|nr:sigma-70 family RNA polymerase sigma factor [Terriglobales bacterium]
MQALLENRKAFVSFVRKHVTSAEDAEDIVQSAFVRSVEQGDTIRDTESVVAWFYRVLRNAIIDHYRKNASEARKAENLAREFGDAVEPAPEIRNEICQCLWPVMESLKPEYREALSLVDIQEKSLRHLAEGSGISENNAGVRVHRARQALRKQIQTTCGSCATHGCIDCRCKSKSAVHN